VNLTTKPRHFSFEFGDFCEKAGKLCMKDLEKQASFSVLRFRSSDEHIFLTLIFGKIIVIAHTLFSSMYNFSSCGFSECHVDII